MKKQSHSGGDSRKTFDVGRDSSTGKFITPRQARSRPTTTTVERVPKRGYGDTGRSKGK